MMNSEGVLSTGMTTSHGIGIQVTLDVDGELTSSYQVHQAVQNLKTYLTVLVEPSTGHK